jgi:hypothetical protein
VVATFCWIQGNHLGRAVIGTKQITMSQLVMPGSTPQYVFLSVVLNEKNKKITPQRSYVLVRRNQLRMAKILRRSQCLPCASFNPRPTSTALSYPFKHQLFALPDINIAVFRRFAQATPIGPSHGMLHYTFSHDPLLLEALLALCLNRWIDWRGM